MLCRHQPRANSRYARKNSQGGQSAIYSTAPEYDDPATCAEEDQYVRLLTAILCEAIVTYTFVIFSFIIPEILKMTPKIIFVLYSD